MHAPEIRQQCNTHNKLLSASHLPSIVLSAIQALSQFNFPNPVLQMENLKIRKA